jgi:hypothetical protein
MRFNGWRMGYNAAAASAALRGITLELKLRM